jgi:ribosomal protein S18 acetylase RimI-like enzyme
MPRPEILIRPVAPQDAPLLQATRAAAFAPIFASFRAILGDEIYGVAQERDDRAHGALLDSLLASESGWEVYVAERDDEVIGFVSVRLDPATRIGEIGLNAVHPRHAGNGVGTALYEFALERMRQAGIAVATVGTGGDPSHEPARRAYRKVGFDVELPTVWMYRKL